MALIITPTSGVMIIMPYNSEAGYNLYLWTPPLLNTHEYCPSGYGQIRESVDYRGFRLERFCCISIMVIIKETLHIISPAVKVNTFTSALFTPNPLPVTYVILYSVLGCNCVIVTVLE